MELEVVRIVKELAWLGDDQRQPIIDRLSPANLRRAVADQFDMETW